MKKIEIEIPDGKRAEWVNGVLTLVDDTPKDIRDRIKTLQDACNELGDEHPLVTQYRLTTGAFKGDPMTEDFIAYLKLRIITAALNEGWKPQFVKGEQRWYVWHDFLTKEKYNDMSTGEKCRVVGLSGNISDAYVGADYGGAHSISSFSYLIFSSLLAFKSEGLAQYAAKQFTNIYADYCFKTPTKNND